MLVLEAKTGRFERHCGSAGGVGEVADHKSDGPGNSPTVSSGDTTSLVLSGRELSGGSAAHLGLTLALPGGPICAVCVAFVTITYIRERAPVLLAETPKLAT